MGGFRLYAQGTWTVWASTIDHLFLFFKKKGIRVKLRGEMSIPPQQQPQGSLPPPSSQQQAQAGGVPVGQGQPPPTGTGDGWRTPEKRQLVIRKM